MESKPPPAGGIGGKGGPRTFFRFTMGAVLWAVIFTAGCASTSKTTLMSEGDFARLATVQLSRAVDLSEPGASFPDNPSLSDYLEFAALHNPGLKAAFDRWKGALWKIPQVRSLPDPRFTYAYFIKEVETRVGPQRQKFALAQTFPWLSKLRLRGDVAAREAERYRALFEAEKWKLFERVKKAYFEYAYLHQAIRVTEENIRLLKHLEKTLQVQYAASIAPYSALVRLQTEMGKLEDRLKTLEDLRKPLMAELNAALNRPGNAPLPWPGPVRLASVGLRDEEIRVRMLEENPEIRALAARAAKEEAGIRLAKTEYYPDVTLSVETVDTGDALKSNTPGSGTNPVIVGVSLNLPVWWSKYDAGVREAAAKWRTAQGALEEKKNDLLARVSLVLYKYRDAERKIDLYKNGLLPKAEHSLHVTLQDFETGLGSYLDVIDAQRILLEFELAYERAEADKAQRLAELERLIGRFLAEEPVKKKEGDHRKVSDFQGGEDANPKNRKDGSS